MERGKTSVGQALGALHLHGVLYAHELFDKVFRKGTLILLSLIKSRTQ